MRRLQVIFAAIVFMCMTNWLSLRVRANQPSGIQVQMSAANAGPREVEDTTQIAIVRDYAAAWKALEASLDANQNDGLSAAFTGNALQQLQDRIAQQKKAGLRTRFVDRGHKLDAVFYSPEGSAMQLHDTAQLEIETLDGNTAVHTETVTLHYVTLMTVAEDRWKVRLLEGVANF